MPQNDQINYNVKVRLDPNGQLTDQSVIWDNTNKKFELGTGTGITITNPSDNNILTADGSTSNIIGENFLRFADGTSTGQQNGNLIIGTTSATGGATNGHQRLDIGDNASAAPFAQLIVHNTVSDDNGPFVRFGLDSIDDAVIGFGAKSGGSSKKFQIGVYGDKTSTTLSPYWSMNHTGRIGMIDNPNSYPTSVLGKSWVDSNYQLLVNRSLVNNPQESGDTSVVGIQNYANDHSPEVKVLQLYAGVQNTNLNIGNQSDGYLIQENPRFIEFYYRNSGNTDDFLMGYVAGWRSGGSFGVGIQTSSDKRLKKDISPLSVGLDTLLKIQPVEFKWKINNGSDKGFIAQDLYEVYPEAAQKPLTDNFEKDPWTIDQTRLIPLLVKSIQDQQKIIEDLKIRITKLEK